ncbi:hypothetical protein SprV_0802570900 [Sparganum proliferum]
MMSRKASSVCRVAPTILPPPALGQERRLLADKIYHTSRATLSTRSQAHLPATARVPLDRAPLPPCPASSSPATFGSSLLSPAQSSHESTSELPALWGPVARVRRSASAPPAQRALECSSD